MMIVKEFVKLILGLPDDEPVFKFSGIHGYRFTLLSGKSNNCGFLSSRIDCRKISILSTFHSAP